MARLLFILAPSPPQRLVLVLGAVVRARIESRNASSSEQRDAVGARAEALLRA